MRDHIVLGSELTMKNSKKSLFFLFILFVLLLLYAYSDVMTSRQAGFRDQSRGLVHIYLSIIIVLLTVYNVFFRCKNNYKNRRKSLTVILSLIVGWVAIVNVINSANTWYSIIHMLMGIWWIMSYHFFYNFSENNPRSKKIIIALFMCMFLFYIWANFYIRNNITQTFATEYAITGYAYYFIVFVPFIVLIQNIKFRNVLWVISLILVVTSYKRGPIIILPLMFIAYYFTKSVLNGNWLKFIAGIIPVLFITFFIFNWIDDLSGSFLSLRFNAEELSTGSGRIDLWTTAINSLKQRGDLSLLIGTGSGSSVRLLGTGVHNEWLEFLFSFGLIGSTLYFFMCVVLIRRYIKLIKQKSPFSPHIGMVTVYVLSVGLFGGFFFVHSTFYVFAFLGLIESLNKNKNSLK